jgi:DNA-binding winged helix-turn-helix (wHTH) protein/cytochrome c-type biogenesis protein CcmH/NrfG
VDRRMWELYEFDSFQLDPLNRRLTHGDRHVPITPMVFKTLLVLVESRGKLVTKSELLTQVWPDTVADETNLAVVISAARKALGDDGHAQKYIETVAKAGYRFAAEVTTVAKCEPESAAETVAAEAILIPPAVPAGSHRSLFLIFGALALAAASGTIAYRWWPHGSAATPASSPASEAEALYLKGRYSWIRGSERGLKQSIAYFDQAISADPGNAKAYAGLADAYLTLAAWSVQAPDVSYRAAKEAAEHAVNLGPSLSEAHSAAGMVAMVSDWNMNQAEAEFRLALKLGPKDPLAHQRLGMYLAAKGSSGEALRELRIASDLDPVSLRVGVFLGEVLYYARQYREAIDQFRKVINLDPKVPVAHYDLGAAYYVQQDYPAAIQELEEALGLGENRDPQALGLYAAARARNGDEAGARMILAQLQKRSTEEYVSAYGIALAHIGLGDHDLALESARQMFRDHQVNALFAGVEPLFDPLRSDPRFVALLPDINASQAGSR